MLTYLDPDDGSRFPLDMPRWCSDTGGPLWIEPGAGIGRDQVEATDRSLWRYRASLPVRIDRPISLGEGCTPLVERAWGEARPKFKCDFLNPTGSFKDRGSSVMLSYLRDHGITEVLEDSSGNGGSSVAGYAAAGDLKATVFAPASTSPGKIAQVKAYGATVELVEGPREQSQHVAIDRATGPAFYASHNWQAFFLQGTKTLAYEIWEDLGFRAPDNVILPVGAGSSLLGCHLGFTELLHAGQITRVPRLFAAQPQNCSPVEATFRTGTDRPVDRPVRGSIAEGAMIARPLRLPQMIRALRESDGDAVAVSEAQIVTALGQLCARGMLVEPTSAVAAAALTHLLERGAVTSAQETVVLLTGSGLKAGTAVVELLGAGEQTPS